MKLATLFLILIMIFPNAIAQTQDQCAPFKQMQEGLESRYNERQLMHATRARGGFLVIFVSPALSYTIVLVQPHTGISCIVDTGNDWSSDTLILGTDT